MPKILLIAKGEFCRYFISPLAYVYLICFLLLNSSFALYFGEIFSSGNASLQPMFDFLPWIYLLFIPGIAMRLWAEEFKSGSILQIMTLPVSTNAFVWGKFLAAWAFCTLALLLTFPFVITINILGSPDNGIIFNSYLGAFLLSGAMLAISQTASALTKNQVIALVIAVIFNLLFFLSGLEYVLSFFRSFTPTYIIDMISSFSFLTHSFNFNFGLFELRDIIFFGSLIALFNCLTLLIISFKTAGSINWLKTNSTIGSIIAAALIFISFIGINLFANNLLRNPRIDFTEEKLFTPSEATRKVLQNLPAPVMAKVYYSPILGERDEQMRLFFDNLRLMLKTYQRLSNGNFSFRIYDPEPLSDIEDKAIQAGIQGLPVSDLNSAAYFGIVLVNENGFSRTIPFFPQTGQKLLEQNLTENIYLLEHQKKKLGLLSSLPILGAKHNTIINQPWQIADELRKYYDIKPINTPDDLEGINLLMIVHPQKMPEDMEKAIYDFSISGGKILAFFDIAAESLRLAGPQLSLMNTSDYGTLPTKWGFKFFGHNVVADLGNSSQVTVETADYAGTTQDLIQFYLPKESFFADLPETANLKRMLTTSASVFLPQKEASIYFIPLIRAGKNSQLMPAAVVTKSIHPAEILRRFKADEYPKYIAARIISQKEETPFDIIVVGDSDLLYDSFWTTSDQIGNQSYNIPLLDNANFVLNALDSLSGNTDLASLRGKSKISRPFTDLEQKQKENLRQFKVKEKDIFDEINKIKSGLQEIWNKKDFEGRQNFTPDELSIISKIKNNLDAKRRELFLIRSNLNAQMEQTEFLVKLVNIYTIPGLLILCILLFKLHRTKFSPVTRPQFNKRFLILLGISVGCTVLGLYSISYLPEKNIPTYENKPLFPQLVQEVNNVTQIHLQNKNKELLFIKEDNRWILKQHPDFMVNQNRIRSFLTSLIQASIYEKKADKVENLPRFGLLPLDNPNSKTTLIQLKNTTGNTIVSFEVGDYNIDLSRGSSGAYIRLPGQFQIWLVAIELIDLNMDYHYWTYADLWNLQFGRLSTINQQTNADYIAGLAGLFLNTQLTTTDANITENPILELNISGEYFDKLNLSFYKHQNNFYVQYKFNQIGNNTVLQKFAAQTANKFYLISTSDMEKIKDAANPKTE